LGRYEAKASLKKQILYKRNFIILNEFFNLFTTDSDAECLSSELAATLNMNAGDDSLKPHGLAQTVSVGISA